MEDGQTVRMQVGQKEVFITFRVERSDYFRRDGSDVHTDAFITLSQAVLGGSVRIQGIYEDLTLDIPRGTASHTRIRLNGKGMRKVNAYGYGDHYVHVKIKVPVRLTEKQKALMLAYAELEEDTPGTINGITYTKDGKEWILLLSSSFPPLFLTLKGLSGKDPFGFGLVPISFFLYRKSPCCVR